MTTIPTATSPTKLDLFLDRLAAHSSTGRLIFALDATMSRQPTWDQACQLQAEMFNEAASVGGLEIQLVYFRGQDECRAGRWMTDARQLGETMGKIQCVGGFTQIAKILTHARREHDKTPISALVFVGDAMEEAIDTLCAGANDLGSCNVRCFFFQEGCDAKVEQAFRKIARLTHGAYWQFSPGSARELGELLRTVAAYAAGGVAALERRKGAVKLLEQLK